MATKSPTRHDQSGRRRKVTKFALAGVAVLGVGAALTSAAWTDNVFFGGHGTPAPSTSGPAESQAILARRSYARARDHQIPARRSPALPRTSAQTVTLELQNDGRRHLDAQRSAKFEQQLGQLLHRRHGR